MCPVRNVTYLPGCTIGGALLTRCEISTTCFDAIGNPYSPLAAWRLGGLAVQSSGSRSRGEQGAVSRCVAGSRAPILSNAPWGYGLKRVEEGEQRLALAAVHAGECIACCSRFAVVPKDCFAGVAGASVVQQSRVLVHGSEQAESPQRRRPPLAAIRAEGRTLIGEPLTQIVQQQIRIWVDLLR